MFSQGKACFKEVPSAFNNTLFLLQQTWTEFNCNAFVEHLLDVGNLDLDSDVYCRITRPLLVAIKKKNLNLVKYFLRAGSSLTYNNHKISSLIEDRSTKYPAGSVIQFAFELHSIYNYDLDETDDEILKFLVSFKRTRWRKQLDALFFYV